MRTIHLHRQLMLRVFAEQDTPPGQAMCLRIVAAHDGATQREIGEMLHLAAPTVTVDAQAHGAPRDHRPRSRPGRSAGHACAPDAGRPGAGRRAAWDPGPDPRADPGFDDRGRSPASSPASSTPWPSGSPLGSPSRRPRPSASRPGDPPPRAYLRPYWRQIACVLALLLVQAIGQPLPARAQRRHHQQRRRRAATPTTSSGPGRPHARASPSLLGDRLDRRGLLGRQDGDGLRARRPQRDLPEGPDLLPRSRSTASGRRR